MSKVIDFNAKRFAVLESGILRPFSPIPINIEEYDPKDLAYNCECGSLKWCIRKDGKLECYDCGSVIENITWTNDNTVHVSEQNASYPNNKTADITRPSPQDVLQDANEVVLSLTLGQAATIRVAIENFISYLHESSLGTDAHGKAMTQAYLERANELRAMLREWEE